MNDLRLILALDFGGTKNSAAVVAVGERAWRNLERRASPAQPDAEYDWQTMIALALDLTEGQAPAAILVSASFDFRRIRASAGSRQ